jgi:hypothetical protein
VPYRTILLKAKTVLSIIADPDRSRFLWRKKRTNDLIESGSNHAFYLFIHRGMHGRKIHSTTPPSAKKNRTRKTPKWVLRIRNVYPASHIHFFPSRISIPDSSKKREGKKS